MTSKEKDPKMLQFNDDEAPPRVLIICPTKAMAPLSVASPWYDLRAAGCIVEFATEKGEVPKADPRFLERSAFRNALGASMEDIEKFYSMAGTDEYLSPHSWSAPDFSLAPFDAVILQTGSDSRLRQYIESPSLHTLMASYFPLTKRRHVLHRELSGFDKLKRRSLTPPPEELPAIVSEKRKDELDQLNSPRKVVLAIGKGVLVLSMSMIVDNLSEQERKSLDNECTSHQESLAKKAEEDAIEKKNLNRRSTGLSLVKRLNSLNSRPLRRSATTGGISKTDRKDKSTKTSSNDPNSTSCAHSERSVIYGVETTAIPNWLENLGTTVSGVYGFRNIFKTYNESTQDQVVKSIGNPSLFHTGPPNTKPFAHIAPTHHYISARYPGDCEVATQNLLEEIAQARKEWGKTKAH